MITIQNLEVQIDVAGDDREEFARLFKEFIRRWHAEVQATQTRELRVARDRSLGDVPPGGPR